MSAGCSAASARRPAALWLWRAGGSAAPTGCTLLPAAWLPCRVINDGIALQEIAARPKAALGYVSDRQVDPEEIGVPLLPKADVTAVGLL